MSASRWTNVNPLLFEMTRHAHRIKCQIPKASNTHPVTVQNPQQILRCQLALKHTHKATTHDHHDQEI